MRRVPTLPTWVLALLIVVVLDVALTRTPLFYGELSIEQPRDPHLVQYVQTLRALRKVAAGPSMDRVRRVVLLGDSRITLAARSPTLEREIRRVAPDVTVQVENLGIFGVKIGDIEALSRSLDRLRPAVVLVALGGSEILPDGRALLTSYPSRIFDLGWRDGPVPPATFGDRLDRWVRTAWPLYRYRELVDMVLVDRLAPDPSPPPPPPDHRLSRRDVFAYRDVLHGSHTTRTAWSAYRTWRRSRRFDDFVQYLRVTEALPRSSSPDDWQRALQSSSIGLRALDRLLDRLARGPWAGRIVLMPANPLLGEDTAGQYHALGMAERTSAVIAAAAQAHGVPLVDARHWADADAFIDFVHLFPDCREFQRPLAVEIARALGVERLGRRE